MIFQYNNKDVYYEIQGEGTPLLLIHGYSLDHTSMKRSFEELLSDSQYQRIYLDLPGMGKSQNFSKLSSSDEILDIVLAFIEDVIGSKPFIMSGMSYGGYLVRGILYHRRDQVLGMQMICPVIIPNHEHRTLPPFEVLEVDDYIKSMSKKDLKGFDQQLTRQTKEIFEVYLEDILLPVSKADGELLNRIYKHGYAFSIDVDHISEPYKVPVSLILGKQDFVVGYKDAFEIVDNFTYIDVALLNHAGHMAQYEQKELFNLHTVKWLEKIES